MMELDSPQEQPEDTVSLDDFCATVSTNDRRVELIAAFHSDEVRSGVNWAKPSDFRKHFESFINKPVG